MTAAQGGTEGPAPTGGCVADGVVNGTEHVATAAQVAGRAAQALLAAPPTAPAPAVPSLPGDVEVARRTATVVVDQVLPQTTAVIEAVLGFASTFETLSVRITEGIASGASAAARAGAEGALVDLDPAAGAVGQRIAEADVAIMSAASSSAASSAQLGADATALSNRIQVDKQTEQALRAQIDRIKAKIDRDHKYELLGWLAGPLGYLAAREIGALADDESKLDNQIDKMSAEAQGAQAESIALTAVVGQLATLNQSAQQMQIGLQALGQGWAALSGFLGNVQLALSDTSKDPPLALAGDVASVASAFSRLADEARTLLGTGEAPR